MTSLSPSSKRSFWQKLRFAASDLILWTVIITVIGAGTYYWFAVEDFKHRQLVRLSFRDANELTKGAMVRMMGVDVGYVRDIKVFTDHVDVIIKTNPGAPTIPSGSLFTITFTGLVGSKSIEIIPPDIPRPFRHGKPQYIVQNPIRMKDTLKYQIDIAQALQRGAENFSDFFGKKKPIEEVLINIKTGNQKVQNGNRILADVNQKMKVTSADLSKTLNEAGGTIGNFSIMAKEAARATGKTSFGPTLYGIVENFNWVLLETRAGMTKFGLERKLQHINSQAFVWIGQMGRTELLTDTDQLRLELSKHTENLLKLNQGLEAAGHFFNIEPITRIKQARSTVQGWNQKLIQWNQKADQQIKRLPQKQQTSPHTPKP